MIPGRRAAGPTRRTLVLLAASGSILAACSTDPEPMDRAWLERFIERSLPAGAVDLQAVTDAGIDRMVQARFEAPEAEARAFAAALAGPEPDPDAASYFDAEAHGPPWWPREVPPGATAFAGRNAAWSRAYKVMTVPAGPGRSVVYLFAFSL